MIVVCHFFLIFYSLEILEIFHSQHGVTYFCCKNSSLVLFLHCPTFQSLRENRLLHCLKYLFSLLILCFSIVAVRSVPSIISIYLNHLLYFTIYVSDWCKLELKLSTWYKLVVLPCYIFLAFCSFENLISLFALFIIVPSSCFLISSQFLLIALVSQYHNIPKPDRQSIPCCFAGYGRCPCFRHVALPVHCPWWWVLCPKAGPPATLRLQRTVCICYTTVSHYLY